MTKAWNNFSFLSSVFPTLLLTRFLCSDGQQVEQPCWMRLLWHSPSGQYWTPGFLLWTKYRGSKCKVSIFNSVFTSAGLRFSSTLFVAKIFKCRAISVIGSWVAYVHIFFLSEISRLLLQLPVTSHTSSSHILHSMKHPLFYVTH